jgi:Holliday junction resolvase RusA-like endonuclease
MIKLVIYGNPVAQGRPKFSTANGFVRAYDPAKSRDYKTYLRILAFDEMKDRHLFDGPLSLSIRIFRNTPKGFSKKKRELAEHGEIRPVTKPDVSNYIKGIEDALNGIVWKDDGQVVAYKEPFGKYYSSTPRIEIEVGEL